MRNAGITTQFVLLRTALSQAEIVIRNADISLNTEIDTIKELSRYAKMHDTLHRIIIMVELGDLREGVLPCDLSQFIKAVLDLPHIKIIGIGCNLACHGGIQPDNENMSQLSKLANSIEKEFQIKLEIISGGNSANYEWSKSEQKLGKINNLRLGELILLGRETINRKAIPGLHLGAFSLIAEVIESKNKPSLPWGEICQNAFGNISTFQDRGIRRRVIIALGRQDVLVSGLIPDNDLEILGSSSDHIILDSNNCNYEIGNEVKFKLDYGGLLSAMTSPFIAKQIVDNHLQQPNIR
jgi:predicted amino acid racemase